MKDTPGELCFQPVEKLSKRFGGKAEDSEKSLPASKDPVEVSSVLVRRFLYRNERGDGEAFAELHNGQLLFNKAAGGWFFWTGHHWEQDRMGRAHASVENVARMYLSELARNEKELSIVATQGDKNAIQGLRQYSTDLIRRIRKLRSCAGRENCLLMAHTIEEPLAVRGDELDVNHDLLACKNGVVELRRGVLRAGQREDMLSKGCPHDYDEEAEAPIWEKTIIEVFTGRKDLANYFQRLCGYALLGRNPEHIFSVWFGQGRNGKSLIAETIHHVLGPLAGVVRPEMLLDQKGGRNSAGPTPDIMAIRGLRFAFASETDQGARFSPSRVKWLTGGDTLTGRNPHDRFEITFQPSHTLFLLTNHKPAAPSDDFAFWERTHLVPFETAFVNRDPQADNERRQDKDLKEKLRAEASGILNWLVQGCLDYQEEGLSMPPIVKEATANYRRAEDLLADFIDDRCVLQAGAQAWAGDLFDSFKDWYTENVSKKEPTARWFGILMSKRFEKRKSSGKVVYIGIGLQTESEDPAPFG